MPIEQTSRLSDRPKYVAGSTQFLNSRQGDSQTNVDVVEIPFGYGVARATNGVTLPVDGTSVFQGVAKLTDAYAPLAIMSNATGYPVSKLVGLVQQGDVVVVTDQSVQRGQQAFWRHTTGGTGTGAKGSFRVDADTARAVAIPAEFVEDAPAGLAILRINKP